LLLVLLGGRAATRLGLVAAGRSRLTALLHGGAARPLLAAALHALGAAAELARRCAAGLVLAAAREFLRAAVSRGRPLVGPAQTAEDQTGRESDGTKQLRKHGNPPEEIFQRIMVHAARRGRYVSRSARTVHGFELHGFVGGVNRARRSGGVAAVATGRVNRRS